MSVRIRLARGGTKKRPVYRIVAINSRSARDGRYLEDVGIYDPTQRPERIELKTERVEHWLKVGAKPSETVSMIIKRAKKQAAGAAAPAKPAK